MHFKYSYLLMLFVLIGCQKSVDLEKEKVYYCVVFEQGGTHMIKNYRVASYETLLKEKNRLEKEKDAYYYKIEDVDLSGARTMHGPVAATVSLPEQFHLYQNYPNPFNPETTIRFTLPQAGHVQLVIFNLLGQKVRTLVDGDRKAGFYSLRWDGRVEFGNPAASGIYYYVIKSGNFHDTMRMILAR